MEELNGKLEDVYKKGVAAIREVDSNHIILLGGAQWNGNFKPFKDSKFDDKIMYTCHRYGGETYPSCHPDDYQLPRQCEPAHVHG